MLEIMGNLAIAEFLWRLGILIWLSEFRLVFHSKICNNNQELLCKQTMKSNFQNILQVNQIWPSKEGLFCCFCIFTDKYFGKQKFLLILILCDIISVYYSLLLKFDLRVAVLIIIFETGYMGVSFYYAKGE